MAVILGKPAAPIPTTQFVIGESKTFTAPLTGRIKVILTGGGGQGAFVAGNSGTIKANYGSGTGGGGGGYSEKTFNVTAGETFTVTIGAGGATALAMNDINSTRVGNNGSNSSFVTASAAETVNMVANGGGGGQMQSGGSGSAHTVAGGTGGTASGGDFNYTGGTGGSVTRVAGNGSSCVVTGGGAVALYGTAFRGGNISVTAALGDVDYAGASGGGGVGGNAGDITITASGVTTGTSAPIFISDGGSTTITGASYQDSSSANFEGVYTSGAPTASATINQVDAQGSGGPSKYAQGGNVMNAYAGGYGGGSGGAIHKPDGAYYHNHYQTGGFGGGGASSYILGSGDYSGSVPVRAGPGGVGGGGSGAWNGRFSQMTSASAREWAPGGDGVCIIMFV
tara:strand:- start:1032 stop:2219 length:1188 start_codon:yes stop_codon:yes gene_type:complete